MKSASVVRIVTWNARRVWRIVKDTLALAVSSTRQAQSNKDKLTWYVSVLHDAVDEVNVGGVYVTAPPPQGVQVAIGGSPENTPRLSKVPLPCRLLEK